MQPKMCRYYSITALTHDIGGEGFIAFSEIDIGGITQDLCLNYSDIINFVTYDQKESYSIIENNINAGLQLRSKMKHHFFAFHTTPILKEIP